MTRTLAFITAFSALAAPVLAQEGGRVKTNLEGTVTDTLGQAVPFALVVLEDDFRRSAVADDSGRFRIPNPKPGKTLVTVRRIGYQPGHAIALIVKDSTVKTLVRLIPLPIRLAGISTTADAARSGALVRNGFYERLRDRKIGAGTGTFLTPEEIQARNIERTSELLHGIAGISTAYSSNDPSIGAMPVGRGNCFMNIYVDGKFWGDGTMGLDHSVPANEIKAMEVYPSGAQTPMQFQRSMNSCGSIVVWTRVD